MIRTKTGVFSKSSATGNQKISGVGFQPKALILYCSSPVGSNTWTDHIIMSYGMSTGVSNSYCVAYAGKNASTPTLTGANATKAKALSIYLYDVTLQAECDVAELGEDSFTLNWTTNNTTPYLIHYIAIGGDDIENASVVHWNHPTVTGIKTVQCGFMPDIVFHATSRRDLAASGAFGCIGLGAMTRTEQWAQTFSENGGTTSKQQLTAYALALQVGSISKRARFSSFDNLGFSVNYDVADSGATNSAISLCIKGGSWKVGGINKNTGNAPSPQLVNIGFRPSGVMLLSVGKETSQVTTQGAKNSIGFIDAIGNKQALFFTQSYSTIPSVVKSYSAHNKTVVIANNDTQTIEASASPGSFLSDGFTLVWEPNDSIATEFLYVAVGDSCQVESLMPVQNKTQGTNAEKSELAFRGKIIIANDPVVKRGYEFIISGLTLEAYDLFDIYNPPVTGEYETYSTTGFIPGRVPLRAFVESSLGIRYYGEWLTFTVPQVAYHKYYAYKVYDNNTLVKVWNQEVLTEPVFTSVINGGGGELTIHLARTFENFGENEDVKLNNRVDCWCYDKEDPQGKKIYSGYISGYRPIIRSEKEYVEVTVFGYIAELQRYIHRDSSGNTTIAYSSYDPANILKDVIDKYREQGGSLSYDESSITLTNTVVSYTFNTNTVKECIDKIIELCPVGWYFYIDPAGIIYLKPKKDTPDHLFFIGAHIKNLDTYRRIEDLTNRVLFTGGGDPPLFRRYDNTGSQTSYGVYEKKIVDQRVTQAATAQIIADRAINTNKDPEIRSTFYIVDSNGPDKFGYDIESVKPGQSLIVKNLKSAIVNASQWDVATWDVDVWDQTLTAQAADVIQIHSVKYEPNGIQIEASSRLPQIAKRIEDIERNLTNTQTVNNPSAPS